MVLIIRIPSMKNARRSEKEQLELRMLGLESMVTILSSLVASKV
jgi:hypothetical protein